MTDCIESFHSVIKEEEIYLHTYQDSKEARRAIFEYIEGWYNLSTFFVQSIDISPNRADQEKVMKNDEYVLDK